ASEEGEMAGFMSEELADDRVVQEKDKRRITRRSLFEGFLVGVVTTLVVTLFAYRMFLMKGFKNGDKAKTEQVAESSAVDSVKSETGAKEDLALNESNAAAEEQKAAEEQQKQLEEEQKKAEEERLKAEEEKKKAEAAKASAVGGGSSDTIKGGTNLYKMSRKHYGSDKYWVYIYEENKAKYPNPNAIPVGAVLRIPELSKYGVTPGDAAGIAAAKKKQAEIFNQLAQKK
ncbi:MAG: hypothetical protein Q4E41_07345, partial [Bacteroidales bacterium]|nr:hypothetical protein [Bacteroidales bacterium]